MFDYGGTLVEVRKPWDEVEPAAIFSVYKTMGRIGLKMHFEQYKELNDSMFQKSKALEIEANRDVPDLLTYQSIVDALFPSKSKAWRRKAATKAVDVFWAEATRNFTLRNSTRPTLGKLKAMKLRMAIISNHHHPQALVRHLNRLRIASYFSGIYVSAEVGLRKPDPRFFEKCLTMMKARPRNSVYVGDSMKYDVEGANSAGMRTILLSGSSSPDMQHNTGTKPAFIVHDLLEVPQIVSSLE
jgi:HAD superfamily hydrolase (TIGR01549 family)